MSKHSHKESKQKAYVVDVNMGYGHSRPAYSLKDLSKGEVISANDYKGIPQKDKKLWKQSRELYETISRLKPVPVIGDLAFQMLDHWQQIEEFYPRRDLSKANIQLRQIFSMIKKGWGQHLIEKLSANPLPIVSTFFIPAFIADYYDYPGKIYCVTTDADISRAWAPMDPKRSRIHYFASNGRVVERLKLYGVRGDHISLTGFPMPKELIGGPNATVLKKDLADRLCRLDPQGVFHDNYHKTIKAEIGGAACKYKKAKGPITITYVVGGAGAQKKLAVTVMESLKASIKQKKIRLILVAGTRKNVCQYFRDEATELGLKKSLDKEILTPIYDTRKEYFSGFSDILKMTDIIWTKPSEMSFYTGLGFPIIMSDPIGSQEDFNRVWLQYLGGGMPMANPKYTNEWLFDWINSGGIARMAWSGYIEAPTHGTYRIEDTVLGRDWDLHPLPLIV